MQRRYRVLVHTGRGVHSLEPDAIDTCLGLPRLTPLEQTAPWVLGAFDLRGELVPVVGLGVLCGEPAPLAAVTDMVLVVLAGGFPIGLHSTRPVRIEPCAAAAHRKGGSLGIDLSRLPLTADRRGAAREAERRLVRFERRLSAQALVRLEQRAHCYGEFSAAPTSPPAPTPAQQW